MGTQVSVTTRAKCDKKYCRGKEIVETTSRKKCVQALEKGGWRFTKKTLLCPIHAEEEKANADK